MVISLHLNARGITRQFDILVYKSSVEMDLSNFDVFLFHFAFLIGRSILFQCHSFMVALGLVG